LKEIRKHYYAPAGRSDAEAAAALITDEILNSVMLIGRKQIESGLADYISAGVNHPIIVPLGGEDQLHRMVRLSSVTS